LEWGFWIEKKAVGKGSERKLESWSSGVLELGILDCPHCGFWIGDFGSKKGRSKEIRAGKLASWQA
jgi:hypothetical protein